MRKERTLFILGLWVSLLSFLGFPSSWKNILFVITGLIIVYISYLFYLEAKYRRRKIEEENSNFIDSEEKIITEGQEENIE